MELIVLPLIVALVFMAGAWRNSIARYKKREEEILDERTILYEEIYAAEKLTGFISRLEAIDKKYELKEFKLTYCIEDLKRVVELASRPRRTFGGLFPIIFDKHETVEEFERLSRRVQVANNKS